MSRPKLVPGPAADDDVVLAPGGEIPPLLVWNGVTTFEAEAVCTAIEPFEFHGKRLRFTFEIVEPEATLPGFTTVPLTPRGRLPVSSKLLRWATIATGSRRVRTVSRSFFLNRLFRVRVAATGHGATAYSVVREILELVAG